MNFLPIAATLLKAKQPESVCGSNACPALCPNQGATLNTLSGRPASTACSAKRSAERRDFSAGFGTIELPAPNAAAPFHVAKPSGKLHGVSAPTTPNGTRDTIAKSPGVVGAISSQIFSMASAYHWNQCTDPDTSIVAASSTSLPMSMLTQRANSSRFAWIKSASF